MEIVGNLSTISTNSEQLCDLELSEARMQQLRVEAVKEMILSARNKNLLI